MKTGVIKRNLFRLLKAGALNEFESLEPMSAFKWNSLTQLIKAQNVISLVQRGIKNHQYDDGMNMPPTLLDELMSLSDTPLSHKLPSMMGNRILNKRLKAIQDNERHEIDTSIETLELLNIIVRNMYAILNHGISLRDILELGAYLRTQGNKVDFVKLDTWLQRLHIQRMARFEGSILIMIFNFEQNEIPFVDKLEPGARRLTLLSLRSTTGTVTEEWHFRQSRTGFVRNNSTVFRRNLRRSIRYFNYAPIETVSSFVGNFTRSLSEIEE